MAEHNNKMSSFQKLMLIFIGIASLSVGYFFVIFLPSLSTKQQQLTVNDCLQLGSNERTELCLNQIEASKPVIPFNDLNLISLDNVKMTGNTYAVPNPTLTATLRNNSAVPLKNVTVQVKFYKYNAAATCSDPNSEDTQYINISNLILPNDSQAIRTIVPTNFDTSGPFSWCTQISSASQYN